MTYETTYRMPRKDGTWFWTVDKGKVVKTENGRLAIISLCSDMTAFVRRKKELEKEHLISESMLSNLPVMDGLEATKQIRSLNRPDASAVPIIAMSANTFKEDIEAT